MSRELIEEFAKKLIEKVKEYTELSQNETPKMVLCGIYKYMHGVVSSKAGTRQKILKLHGIFSRFLSTETDTETKMPYIAGVRFNDSLNGIDWGRKTGYGVEMDTDKHIELLEFIKDYRNPNEIVNTIKDVLYEYIDPPPIKPLKAKLDSLLVLGKR